MKCIRFLALLLVIIGALNWGLWGFFQYDVVAALFGGPSSGISRLIYSLVGIAGLYGISFFFHHCSSSSSGCCSSGENNQNNQNNQNKQ